MLRVNHCGSFVCIATYVGHSTFSNQASCDYDRQVPIRYRKKASINNDQTGKDTKKFAYVIIGCGVSGSAALSEILAKSEGCKSKGRDILVVDSQRKAFVTLGSSGIINDSNFSRVQYMEGSVIDMNLPTRELKLSDGSLVNYESCLISVGTKLANTDLGEKMLAEDCSHDLLDMSVASSTDELMKAVKSGQHVSLLGADTWGVISIASQLADYSRSNGFKGTVSIITPSPGVMASSLPRYLSVALGKRLNTKGIELVAYSQVRYVGGPSTFAFVNTENQKPDTTSCDHSSPQSAKIGIYLSRVYDALNTSMLYTDKVALFPSSIPIANQGPPMNCSSHFAAKAGLEVGTNGGFLVNRCMLASDGVYISGEVANVRTALGRGIFTGVDHAHHTGMVAGRNMAGVFDVYDHIPIYEASAQESDIHLTFVGHCSSAFETHGFWWRLGGSSSSSSSSSSSVPSSSGKGRNSSGDAVGPAQQSFAKRLQSDLYGIFGYRPSGESKASKIISFAPKGKGNVRKTDDDAAGGKLQPPLGLGVLFYVDNEVVVGVLISGSPLAQQREKRGEESGGTESEGDVEQDELSFSEIIHERARSFVGRPLKEVAASVESEIFDESGNIISDFRSGRLIRLQNLSEVASYVVAPAILPVDRSTSASPVGNKTALAKAEFKKITSMLPRPNYRYSPPSRTIVSAYVSNLHTETSTVAPTIMQENVFHVGADLTGTRAEKLAAAYASGLRYGIDGPPKGQG